MIALLLLACGPSEPPPAPELLDVRAVVPSDGLPSEVVVQDSANNLDVEWHDGRLFFAFRTGPSHFASPDVVMYVVSTEDEQTWRFEGAFDMDTDLREPQLVSFGGELHFTFAVLGTNLLDFEPQGAKHAVYNGPGDWSEPVDFYDEGFIPWRIEVEDEVIRMTGYVGGENVYDLDGDPIRIHFVESTDMASWTPVGSRAVVFEGAGSESDWAWLDDGSLVSVVRVEAYDPDGMGSRVCTAPASDPSAWDCAFDPRKYDSPLVFAHRGAVWLVGRRNLTETGHYDISTLADPEEHYLDNQFAYWNERKRCTLWRVDPDTRTVAFEYDLPSRGDTCFPEVVPLVEADPDGDQLLYNYSNPVDGADPVWQEGQTGTTWIYRQVLAWP